ncbi:hypothetical protein EIP91_011515, partial [Steccherinum ochraceum]
MSKSTQPPRSDPRVNPPPTVRPPYHGHSRSLSRTVGVSVVYKDAGVGTMKDSPRRASQSLTGKGTSSQTVSVSGQPRPNLINQPIPPLETGGVKNLLDLLSGALPRLPKVYSAKALTGTKEISDQERTVLRNDSPDRLRMLVYLGDRMFKKSGIQSVEKELTAVVFDLTEHLPRELFARMHSWYCADPMTRVINSESDVLKFALDVLIQPCLEVLRILKGPAILSSKQRSLSPYYPFLVSASKTASIPDGLLVDIGGKTVLTIECKSNQFFQSLERKDRPNAATKYLLSGVAVQGWDYIKTATATATEGRKFQAAIFNWPEKAEAERLAAKQKLARTNLLARLEAAEQGQLDHVEELAEAPFRPQKRTLHWEDTGSLEAGGASEVKITAANGPDATTRVIAQVWTQMVTHKVRLAVLTSYDATVFVARGAVGLESSNGPAASTIKHRDALYVSKVYDAEMHPELRLRMFMWLGVALGRYKVEDIIETPPPSTDWYPAATKAKLDRGEWDHVYGIVKQTIPFGPRIRIKVGGTGG